MNTPYVCWRCSLPQRTSLKQKPHYRGASLSPRPSCIETRPYHHSTARQNTATSEVSPEDDPDPPPTRRFYGFKLRRLRGDRTVKELMAWQEDFKRKEMEAVQEGVPYTEKPFSPLTRLVMTSKLVQTNADLDGEDLPTYSVLQGHDEAGLQSQRFNDNTIAFEESDDLRPGDLVDYFDKDVPAIYVRKGPIGGRTASAQLYTLKGEVVEVPERRICFRVPHFCSHEEVQTILPYFPNEAGAPRLRNGAESLMHNVPRHLSRPLLSKMAQFHREASSLYRRYYSRIDNGLEILEGPEGNRTVTLAEASKRIFKIPSSVKPTPETLWAVYLMLSSAHAGAMRTPVDYRKSQLWHIKPRSMHDLIGTVISWWHEYQSWKIGYQPSNHGEACQAPKGLSNGKYSENKAAPTDSRVFVRFFSMARERVQKNRKLRHFQDDPPMIGPPTSASSDEHQTPHEYKETTSYRRDDRLILRFLLSSAREEVRPESQISVIAAMVIRELGLYAHVEDKKYGAFLFLQEMGVLSPWEGREISVASLGMPGYSLNTNIDQIQQIMQKTTGPHVRRLKDRLKDSRKIWSDDVYCIDSEKTTTIDDGFSIERIQGSDSEIWLHVHVANPTAFLTTSHPIVQYARQMGSTVYLPNTVYSSSDANFIAEKTSLEKKRPCLTFSAKLDRHGNMLEHQVSSGLLQNVKFLTPETVREVVGSGLNRIGPTIATISVGNLLTEAKQQQQQQHHRAQQSRHLLRPDDLTSQQVADLKLWKDFANAWRSRRVSPSTSSFQGAFQRMTCSVRVSGGPPVLPDYKRARTIAGDPRIELQLKAAPPPVDSSDQADLVEEAMLIAGNVAATWCARRGIPAPYRVSTTKEGLPSRQKYFAEVVEPFIVEGKPVPSSFAMEMARLNKSDYSIAPKEHEDLGLSAYLRVTSPLRRWPDMIAHFQIEAALAQEAEGRTSSDEYLSKLPFQAERVASEITFHELLQTRHFLLTREAQREWIIRALARAYYWKESALPMTISVSKLPQIKSVLSNFEAKPLFIANGFNVLCELDESSRPADEGAENRNFEAEIVGVSVERQKLFIRLQ